MGRRASTGLLIAVVTSLGVASCKYEPHPVDGTLRCSTTGECPEGYSCQATKCWSSSGLASDAGLGGDAIAPAVLNRYIGNWVLGPTAMVVTRCDDNFVETTLLSPPTDPSIMTIQAGNSGVADLDSSWLCDHLLLRLDANGAHLFDQDPTCTDGSDPTQTWTATRFEVSTSNGTTATHTAVYNRVDQYANGTVTNCIQTVNASMTKQ